MGLLIASSGALQAENFITNEKIIGAFAADEEVQAKTRAVRQQLRASMPNCVLGTDQNLRGHLFGATNNTHPVNGYRRRTYLVSRHVTCSQNFPGAVLGVRRAVTAKVLVNVRRLADGTLDETPMKVVVVDITNSDTELE